MHDIVHELTIAAEPRQIYEAITTEAGLASWWTTDVAIASADGTVEGTLVTLGFDDHQVVIDLRVDSLDPPLLAHLTCVGGPEEWPGTQLAFRVEPLDAGGSVVRFWHGGWEYEDGVLPRVSFNWAMYLDSLRRAVETGSGSPA
jgi:uncharacterized protein YndB with AHSA1/START domain